ncbi:MAG: Proton/sodium-glutamate symport protein [Syntrophus sp. SKADARSKE-3]|nr:Proton/sodium-glutamate symport protein [Syntrophus sp. SKADARSKE-3]
MIVALKNKHFRLSHTQLILIGMAVGCGIGALYPSSSTYLEPLSTIFIRLVKSIVVPIIVSTLVVGIAGHGDIKAVGRMGIKSIIYFEVITTFALVIGLAAVNLIRPGSGVNINSGVDPAITGKQQSLGEIFVHIFPQNFLESAARGDILQVVVFTILFSIALIMIGAKKKPIVNFCEALAETMFKYTGMVMAYAPIGVGAAIAVAVGSKGLNILLPLCQLIGTFYISVVIFIVLVLIPVILMFKIPLGKFFSAVKEPAVIAFSTTSSEAALPKAMESMIKFGVPQRIVAFVIPTGYSFNLDGTTLYLPLAAVFVAQAFGIELSFPQQLAMGLTIMLASKGCAGIPRASIVILAGILPSFGLPLSALAILLAIDSIIDMGRTAVNVVGNCLASVVIAKWENAGSPENLQAEVVRMRASAPAD